MLEALDDLKNNKKKIIKGSPTVLDSWKKILLEALKQKGIFKLQDPLAIVPREFLYNTWPANLKSPAHGNGQSIPTEENGKNAKAEPKEKSLASALRINTLLRRQILDAISSSSDILDAIEKLDIFKSSKERREIPSIILLCVKKEKSYNPFYALLSSTLIQRVDGIDATITFMYALWDFSRSLSGKVSIREILNAASFYADLLGKSSLSFCALKVSGIVCAYFRELNGTSC